MGRSGTRKTQQQKKTAVLETRGQRSAFAIYSCHPLRSVLSHRPKRVLDPSGTYITQEGSVAGLVLNITLRIIIYMCPCGQGYSGGSEQCEVSFSQESRAVSEQNTIR